MVLVLNVPALEISDEKRSSLVDVCDKAMMYRGILKDMVQF